MPTIRRTPILPLLMTFLLARTANAQEPHPLDHGHNMLKEGVELETQDKRAEALEKYATVHRSDSLYDRVLLQRVFDLIHLGRHQEAVALSDEGIRLDGKRTSDFFYDKVAALIGMKEYDHALAVIDEYILRYPGNYDPHRLKAEALVGKKDHAAALVVLKYNVAHFPMSAQAHLSLAAAAQQEDRTAQAALALFAAMLVRWNDKTANQTLGYVDQLLDGKLDKDAKGSDLTIGDDFAELDLLLKNKVGMTKGYKAEPDLPYACVRQGHFLLHALKDHPAGDGFWTTFYVPFFRALVEKDLVEGMLYHCLANSDDERILAMVAKNKKKVEAFRIALTDLFYSTWAVFPDSIGGTFRPVKHQYYDEGDLLAVGDGNMEKDQQTGPWEFYHPNGKLSMRATYGTDHKKNGLVTNYHDNGRILLEQEWKAGVEDGFYRSWYRNGAMKDSTGVMSGKAQGPFAQFSPDGALSTRKTFKDGELTGRGTTFLTCGTPEATMDLVKDSPTGTVTWLYANGRPRFIAVFKDGKRNGVCETFHPNGAKEKSYTYVNDLMDGPYTEWSADGRKREEGTYKGDRIFGQQRTWYPNGVLSMEQEFDDQGRSNGVRKDYTTEGQLQTELEYGHGLLIRYRYYDRTGKLLKEDKRSKGRFHFEGFTADGAKAMQGSYYDEGQKDGKWTWWYPDGTVSREENLVKGRVEGVQRTFHLNGQPSVQYDYLPGKEGTGPFTSYATDGTVEAKGWLENEKLNGERLTFLPNGKLLERQYYVNGTANGWQTTYDPDGIIGSETRYAEGELLETVLYDATGKEHQRWVKSPGVMVQQITYPDGRPYSTIHYMNGKRHGSTVAYFPDGTKANEMGYVNGDLQGIVKSWHPNGVLFTEAQYDMGALTGTSRRWGTDGILLSEETYENGLSTGQKVYHGNGALSIDRPKRSGVLHGAVKSYSPSGELQLVRYYRDARLVGYSYNAADGKLVDTIPLTEGLASMRPKYANGKPSREMDMRNGEIDGTYREFNPDGSPLQVQPYSGGERNGEAKEYYGTGKLFSSCNWVNDGQHGEELIYWENGQLRERCMWVYGQRHGERILYDKAGKPALTMQYRGNEVVTMKRP